MLVSKPSQGAQLSAPDAPGAVQREEGNLGRLASLVSDVGDMVLWDLYNEPMSAPHSEESQSRTKLIEASARTESR